jgi:succinyl-CoA:acetate CoA-transferase
MTGHDRIGHIGLRARVMDAQAAAALIPVGAHVGMSGFTGAGHPKAVPQALAARLAALHAAGQTQARISLWTGASTAPELDGALALADGIDLRLPYQADPDTRRLINEGRILYTDIHLSHVPQMARYGFLGRLDAAVIEVTAIREDGQLIPSTSIGNNKTWLDLAERVILEVNLRQDRRLEGLHDIPMGTDMPPHRQPLALTHPGDRIGSPYLACDPDKVVAVVLTDQDDRHTEFTPPGEVACAIAGHLVEFLRHEVQAGRLPPQLLPLQSGVGNTANAVLGQLAHGPFHGLTAYTEVLQDGMLDLLRSGRMDIASSAALALSPQAAKEFFDRLDVYRSKVVLRPQGISNHPELIRRLGVISMNTMIEADIYGNVNSTHLLGTRIMNGIGGSGDFTRNAYLSVFMSASTARDGRISCIVPMVSHHDHTEHDVQVLVTEHGLADLRGLAPTQRAALIIERCAHPAYRDALRDYLARARLAGGQHTPHLLDEALGWHSRYLRTGQM